MFGRCLGRQRRIKRDNHLERLLYRISKPRNQRKDMLKLKIRKTHQQCRKILPRKKFNSTIYAAFYCGSDQSLKFKIRKVKNLSPKGYRFINLACLQSHISEITMHVCLCLEAMKVASTETIPIKLDTEVNSLGLANVMSAQCQGCFKKFTLNSNPRMPGSKRFEINVRAVWGSMVADNGPSHQHEFLATLNSPGLSQPSFSAIETVISKWWHAILEKNSRQRGKASLCRKK